MAGNGIIRDRSIGACKRVMSAFLNSGWSKDSMTVFVEFLDKINLGRDQIDAVIKNMVRTIDRKSITVAVATSRFSDAANHGDPQQGSSRTVPGRRPP